ncbi:MAG: NmrA family NAD(P)-binding protein [Chitinophagaceae bacterium]
MATILIAGATGNLGRRIVSVLIKKGATVRAIVRTGTDRKKIDELEQLGVEVIKADMYNIDEVTKACSGVDCVVSALQGLRDVLIDTQAILLHGAIAAGVPRFIPSDFSSDFTKLTPGENRNFDIRREFLGHLDEASIKATSILNGAFAELLTYNIPLLDFKNKQVGYWENADWQVDFSSMDDTAAFTAAAAMDPSTPRLLRIASFQVSPRELATIAGEVKNTKFELVRLGNLEELAAYNRQERAAHPEGENEVFPRWQSSQYIQSMFTVHFDALDNDRYPDLKWTSVREVLGGTR